MHGTRRRIGSLACLCQSCRTIRTSFEASSLSSSRRFFQIAKSFGRPRRHDWLPYERFNPNSELRGGEHPRDISRSLRSTARYQDSNARRFCKLCGTLVSGQSLRLSLKFRLFAARRRQPFRAVLRRNFYLLVIQGSFLVSTRTRTDVRTVSLSRFVASNPFKVNVLVARDGIEPPTPAFSGLRSTD